jgi:hypothetical protein
MNIGLSGKEADVGRKNDFFIFMWDLVVQMFGIATLWSCC